MESCIFIPKGPLLEVLVAFPGFGLKPNLINELVDGLNFAKQHGVPAQFDICLL